MTLGRYDFERIGVLVVDDNKHMRNLVKSILHALGIKNVREVGDAAEAFKELQRFSADLVITDWHMEPLDGLDFVRLVRTAKDSPNPYIPIIMLTGHTELVRVMEARDAGVNEFLAKPISARGLYARMVSIIEHPRPFIRTKSYFGPDRRRNDNGPPRGMSERRKDDRGDAEVDEREPNLSPEELQTLLNK